MKGYCPALGLALLLGAVGAASATTATIDFNDSKNSTANTQLIATGANGAVTMVTNVGADKRNAVQTGGTTDNEFLYISLPKDMFKGSKAVWVAVEYYDQGTDTFGVHYTDNTGADTPVLSYGSPALITKHDTKTWTTYTSVLPNFGFTEAGPGGSDLWIDDQADGPEIIDKITVTDVDPSLFKFPHVDPAHPIKIDGVIDPAEWAGANIVVLNQASQDAVNNYPGADKFSGTYYHKWDESGLYVAGDVVDVTPRMNDQTGDAAWSGDGLEEFLSLDWSDPSHDTYLPGTDFHVFIGLGDTPQMGLQYELADLSGEQTDDLGPIPTDNLVIKNVDSPKGYVFEMYLPWKTLLDHVQNTKTKITAGQSIGWFMFANNSNEVGPSQQDNALDPVKRTGPSGHPSVWVTTLLDSGFSVTP